MATDQSKRSIDSGKSHDQINKRVRVENGKDSSTRMTINSYYLKEDFIHSLKEKFQLHCENEPKKTTEISSLDENKSGQCDLTSQFLHSSPFIHCVLPELIREDHYLDRLQGELQELTFNEKNNDLYNFHQSSDLKHASGRQIAALRNLFYKDILQWMKKVTGIELSENVDLFCSIYEYTDVLLCHDDELEGRRIAFILYLVPPWLSTDGGSLDLFGTNDFCQPVKVEKSIYPTWNQFTFFEVSPKSFHQVAEVLSKEKTRLSVSGWFHGPNIPRPPAHPHNKVPLLPCLILETDLLYNWINTSYLDLEVQAEIREKFELESEIQLQDFLKLPKYMEVNAAFQNSQLEWIQSGPANRRNIYLANEDTFPDVIRECLRLLRSEIMFLLLSNLTGLKLHREAAVSDDEDDREQKRPHRKLTEVRDAKMNAVGFNVDCDSPGEQAMMTFARNPAGVGNSSSTVENLPGSFSPKAEKNSIPNVKELHPATDSTSCEEINHKSADNAKLSANESSVASASSNCKARCSYDVRLWRHGCYTLLQDTDAEMADYALDALLFFGCENWQPDYGGYVSYIVKGEDEELLTVSPAHNSLALVYRDKETLRFVKHVNHQITQMSHQKFFDISFIYYE